MGVGRDAPGVDQSELQPPSGTWWARRCSDMQRRERSRRQPQFSAAQTTVVFLAALEVVAQTDRRLTFFLANFSKSSSKAPGLLGISAASAAASVQEICAASSAFFAARGLSVIS